MSIPKNILKNIFLHFFPLTCSLCKTNSILKPDEFCEDCISKLSFISEPFCKNCGGSNDTIFDVCSKCMKEGKTDWKSAFSIFEMRDFSRNLIIKYKYHKDTPLVRPLSKFCLDKINSSELSFDLITYIPLHWTKYLKRGFNQSQLIAKYISGELNISSAKLLKRIKYTKSQTKLSIVKRRKNIKGAFKAINKEHIKDKKILLLDDVYTTGSTLREASKVLYKAHAKEVHILTLARR